MINTQAIWFKLWDKNLYKNIVDKIFEKPYIDISEILADGNRCSREVGKGYYLKVLTAVGTNRDRKRTLSLKKICSERIEQSEKAEFRGITVNKFNEIWQIAKKNGIITPTLDMDTQLKSFNEWLLKKNKVVELTKENYSKYCTFENLKSYLTELYRAGKEQDRKGKKVTEKQQMDVGLISNTSKVKISYEWDIKKSDTIRKVYQKLVDKSLITGTEYKDFKKIFSGKPISEITPITWNSKASELLYFVIQLQKKGFIPEEKRTNYELLKECFVKNDDSSFTKNFKTLKYNLNINLSDKRQKFIDEVLK